jgi:hypothetical protein
LQKININQIIGKPGNEEYSEKSKTENNKIEKVVKYKPNG